MQSCILAGEVVEIATSLNVLVPTGTDYTGLVSRHLETLSRLTQCSPRSESLSAMGILKILNYRALFV